MIKHTMKSLVCGILYCKIVKCFNFEDFLKLLSFNYVRWQGSLTQSVRSLFFLLFLWGVLICAFRLFQLSPGSFIDILMYKTKYNSNTIPVKRLILITC